MIICRSFPYGKLRQNFCLSSHAFFEVMTKAFPNWGPDSDREERRLLYKRANVILILPVK